RSTFCATMIVCVLVMRNSASSYAIVRRPTAMLHPRHRLPAFCMLDDPSSSRQHAELFSAPDGFYVRDLNSRYGVFVNKVKINNPYHLSHGDRVVLGNTLLYFSHLQKQVREQPANDIVNAIRQASQSSILKDSTVISSQAIRKSMVDAAHSVQKAKEPVV